MAVIFDREQPLFVKNGSIRAIIALIVTGMWVMAIVKQVWFPEPPINTELFGTICGLFGMVVRDYYEVRKQKQNGSNDSN